MNETESTQKCDRCVNEAFDLWLGEWVCRPCKRKMESDEYEY